MAQTKHERLMEVVGMYEPLLNPKIFNLIVKSVQEAYEENKDRAFEEVGISKEARDIEQKLIDLRRSLKTHADHPGIIALFRKQLYKELIKSIS